MKRSSLAALLTAGALLAPALAWAGPALDSIKQRGALRCGLNTGLIGFSTLPDVQALRLEPGQFFPPMRTRQQSRLQIHLRSSICFLQKRRPFASSTTR